MEYKAMTYQQFAESYFKPKIEEIRNELDKRYKVKAKLAYLMKQIEALDQELYAVGTNLKTTIKTSVKDHYAIDKLDDYVQGQCHTDFMQLCSEWNDKYEDGVSAMNNGADIDEYISINKEVLPHEVLAAFKASNTTDLIQVRPECVAGICLGMIRLGELLEVELNELIEKSTLSSEVMDEINEKYGSKIIWTKSIRPLARLFSALKYSDHIGLKSLSQTELPGLVFSHFHVSGRSKNSVASISSFKRPFLEEGIIARDLSKQLDKLLTD